MLTKVANTFGKLLPLIALLSLMISPLAFAEEIDLWESAKEAYRFGHDETGHMHLKALMEKNPGDVDLAWKCLNLIFDTAGRFKSDDQWTYYAARRICALERIGAVSATDRTVRQAYTVTLDYRVRRGQMLEAVEIVDRFVAENPHDLFWRISQAQLYRSADSPKTRPMYQKLKSEMDLDHPLPAAREIWHKFSLELKSGTELPATIQPLPFGSLVPLMNPDDPDGEWNLVATRSPREIARQIDRLAAKLLAPDTVVPWRDESGVTDPSRALDMLLLRQQAADMDPLRRIQALRFNSEVSQSIEVDPVSLFRRYPWALPAQKLLLEDANRALWSGRSQVALRSFGDVLAHANDDEVLSAAQVGYWTALAQTDSADLGENLDGGDSVALLLGNVDPQKTFKWLGKPTAAEGICKQLLANQSPAITVSRVPLKELTQKVIHLPPVSPWSTSTPTTVDLVVNGKDLLASGRDVLAYFNTDDLSQPVWSRLQQHHAEESRPGNYFPGYFRPQLNGSKLYTRFGFRSVPSGVAAIDRQTGSPLWSNEENSIASNSARRSRVPMCDPLLSDGLLYYSQWYAQDNINHNRGRRIQLVCFDPESRTTVWESTTVKAGAAVDILGHIGRSSPQYAIYGNRLTIHEGAIYCNSNCGFVARSDVRNGQPDWIYYYQPGGQYRSQENLGSAPIVVGDKVIFMPRDCTRIFAIDRESGRLVWDNPLVVGLEAVGVFEGLLLVRGAAVLAALDVESGEVRWYRPLNEPVVGRVQLSGDVVYLARGNELRQLDAKTGDLLGTREWKLNDERPRNFAIDGNNLYVVTDTPAADPEFEQGKPFSAEPNDSPKLTLPLRRAWSLPRANAQVALPPEGSPLVGSGYVFASGILECIDVSARGGMRWQRFSNASQPRVHFVDDVVLVVDQTRNKNLTFGYQATAYNGKDGRVLWEQTIPHYAHQTITCGSTQVFHDGRARIIGLDLKSGQQIWQRSLGLNHFMQLARDGDRLHVFAAASAHAAKHIVIDGITGNTVSETSVEPEQGPELANNGKVRPDGYYEVKVKPIEGRFIRLVALSEVNGGGWTSISELQVIGPDNENVRRDKWRTHFVDSFESKARMKATPECAFDNDPVTWWHTPWLPSITSHPHEIQIDLGALQQIHGIRYLPAVIINNNGMIKDYELYVSKDGKSWGEPVAKGVLVNRVRVDQARLGNKTIIFESRDRRSRINHIYRYSMDGKPAKSILQGGRIAFLHEPYFGTIVRSENRDVLQVQRVDDPNYRFELGRTDRIDMGSFEIEGDRIVVGRRAVLVADLAKREFIIQPGKDNPKHDQNGICLWSSNDRLLKIVNQGQQSPAVFQFDVNTGERTDGVLSNQFDPLLENPHVNNGQRVQRCNGVVIFNDNTSVSAWVSSP
jgi:outer membrane protein assembly factor BamB